MAQSNIYAQKENGDLRLLAEIEGESDPALAVDALLDEMPRLKQRQFVVINIDNVMLVEASDEIVQPRRQMTITSGNNVGAVIIEDVDDDETTEGEEEGEPEAEQPEDEAPKPRRGRPRGKQASSKRSSTRGRGKGRGRKPAASTRKSPFKSNPASAE